MRVFRLHKGYLLSVLLIGLITMLYERYSLANIGIGANSNNQLNKTN